MSFVQSISVGCKVGSPILLCVGLQNYFSSIEGAMHFLFPHYDNYEMGR